MACSGDTFPFGPGRTLTQDQIRQLWLSNGGQPNLADVMSAIAIAESSGHTSVVNDCQDSGDYSVGLWQIDYLGSLLGPRTQRYGSPQSLAGDPNAQARAAVDLAANGTGLSNWSTYKSGAYKSSLGSALGLGGGNSSPGGGGGTTAAQTSTGSGEQCLIKAPSQNLGLFSVGGSCLLGTAQARAVLGSLIAVGGGVLMLGGLAIVVSGGKQAQLIAGLTKLPGVGMVARRGGGV